MRVRAITTAYLSVLRVYGLAVALGDFWTEQIVKRGWTSERIPGLGTIPAPLDWAGIILVGFGIALAVHRRLGISAARSRPYGEWTEGRLPPPLHLLGFPGA